jgi:4,5-DOPA dioxygenase extradiol
LTRKSFIQLLGCVPFLQHMTTLSALSNLQDNLPLSPKMPVLFLGHGSPMNAIEENEFVRGFREIAKKMPKPKAIVCISAHWFTQGTKVTAMPIPKTIHDFGGFPEALYQVQYPAKGDPELAKTTKHLLAPTQVALDETWGLDHGAWSVLKHLYPKADVPVIQLSIDYTKAPEAHYELAQQLKQLRNKGILLVGSGNLIHNLGLVDFQNINRVDYGYDWAIEANELIHNKIRSGNVRELVNYAKLGKAMQLAVPTPEHYLPMVYTLGLMDKSESIELFNDKLLAGSLSMTSLRIGA